MRLTTDGITASAENPQSEDIFTGRVQFQPEIAVDPVTGTVVISWRDGRDDRFASPGGDLPDHEHRRGPDFQRSDLRQSFIHGP